MGWKSGLRVLCQGRLIVKAGKHNLIMPFLIWVGQRDLTSELCGVCWARIGSWKVAKTDCLVKTPVNKNFVTCNALCVGSCLSQWCQKPSRGLTTYTDHRNSDAHGEACADTSGAGGGQHQLDQLQDQAERRAASHFAKLMRVSWPMDQLKGVSSNGLHAHLTLSLVTFVCGTISKAMCMTLRPIKCHCLRNKATWPAARTWKRCCKRLERLASKGG